MTVEKLLGWRKLFLILTVIPCYMSLQVSIPQQQYKAAKGDEIMMTCNFVPARPISGVFVLTWETLSDIPGKPTENVASFYLNAQTDYAPGYEGRTQLEVDIDKQVSTLLLKKLTLEDSCHYQCSVMISGDDEGKTAATTSLLVLVPPSPPSCTLQGTAEYFHDITLTCHSQEASPEPVYEWNSHSVENNPRPLPPKATQKDGVLSLFNISRETSGYYICTSTNEMGSARCNFTLAVVESSISIASAAGIIGGVVAAVLLLGILVFCCCKKGKKDKYAEDPSAEMEYYDKDGPEAGKQYRDDESIPEKKQVNSYTEDVPRNTKSVEKAGQEYDDDQHSHSYNSGKGRLDGNGSDISSQRYQDDQRDRYRGSRDRLDDQRDRYGGSRDRLDDQRDRYRGSRDRLDDQRDRYGGSRDRLDDQRERYGGSRDRLDDHQDHYRGSRDRLDDQRDRYGGGRDHLYDQRNRYGGSRDRLDDYSDRRGSRDNLNESNYGYD